MNAVIVFIRNNSNEYYHHSTWKNNEYYTHIIYSINLDNYNYNDIISFNVI